MRSPAVIAVAIFFGASPASAGAFQEYNFPDQEVAIQFPEKPKLEKSTYDSIYGKGFPATVISAEDDHVVYKLTVVDLSRKPDNGANFLNEAANRILRDSEILFTDFTRVYQDERSVFGTSVVADRKDGTRVRTTLYGHRARLYIAEAIVLPARGDKDMTTPSRYDQTIRFPPDGRFD
jgi:hypothetical protein